MEKIIKVNKGMVNISNTKKRKIKGYKRVNMISLDEYNHGKCIWIKYKNRIIQTFIDNLSVESEYSGKTRITIELIN